MAQVPLSNKQYNRIVTLLTKCSEIATVRARQTMLDESDLSRFAFGVQLEGDTRNFAADLVRKVHAAGTLDETDQPALVNLLRWLRRALKGDASATAFLDGLLAPYPPPPDAPAASPAVRARHSRIRLLILAANPAATERLQLDQELRTIRERLREAQALNRFQMQIEMAVRESDLSRAIQEHRPTLIHFCGHGEQGGALVLEDRRGNARALPPGRLAQLFAIFRGEIQGVVINACWSRAQAEVLVAQAGVPWVVGMARAISQDAARDFAGGFYRGLGFGQNLERAFRLGCFELGDESPDEEKTPQLLLAGGVDAQTVTF